MAAMPQNLRLQIYRGDTYQWQFTCWTDLAKTQPANFIGSTVVAEVRTAPEGTLIFPFTTQIVSQNVIAMSMSHPQSMLLTPQTTYAWDLQVTYPNALVSTILAGPVSVTLDVSQSA